MSVKQTLLASIVGVALCSSSASAALYFSQDGNTNGLFSVDVTTGAATPVGISGVTGSTVGLAPSPDSAVLFGSKWSTLLSIQADGSGASDLGGEGNEGLAYCSSNNTLYGAINGSFRSINQADGSVLSPLSDPGTDIEGIACDPATNTIYGIGDNNNLYKYNIGTDSWSVVGNTGINWDSGGLAWDPSGVLYAIGNGGGDNLYSLNPATAAATLIGPLGTTAEGGLAFVPGSVPVPLFSFWGLGILAALFGFAGSRRRWNA